MTNGGLGHDGGASRPLLSDHVLPHYQFSEEHDCLINARPSDILDAVERFRPEDDLFFRAMIGIREVPMRLLDMFRKKQGRARAFSLDDFTLLGRDERAITYGLVGSFWATNYGLYPIADADDFKAFNRPNVAKLVLDFQVGDNLNGQTRLTTRTRIYCPDQSSYRKFLPYWLLIRPVSGMIRRRILSSIKRMSEGR